MVIVSVFSVGSNRKVWLIYFLSVVLVRRRVWRSIMDDCKVVDPPIDWELIVLGLISTQPDPSIV
jgi:hypothetical protein